jgi:large subunit ribosomal protein L22
MPDKIDREELRRIVLEKVQAEIAAGRTPHPRRVKGAVSVELTARGRKAKQDEVRRQVKEEVHKALRLRRFVARIRHARISPRKMRRVNQLIRGKDVNAADAILRTVPQRGAGFQKKLLQSAVANATYLAGAERTELDVNRLHVIETQIPPGPTMYRARPSSERHPYRIRKRFSHAIVVLEERDLPAPKKERGKKRQAGAGAGAGAAAPAAGKQAPKAAVTAREKPAAPESGPPPAAGPKKTTRRTATQRLSAGEPPKKPTKRATKRRPKMDEDKGEKK